MQADHASKNTYTWDSMGQLKIFRTPAADVPEENHANHALRAFGDRSRWSGSVVWMDLDGPGWTWMDLGEGVRCLQLCVLREVGSVDFTASYHGPHQRAAYWREAENEV